MSAVLKFPTQEGVQKKRTLVAGVRPEPVLRSFSREDSHALLGVAQKVHQGTNALLDLVDSHRDTARDAGVETIAIELGSERDNVNRILDSLEESEVRQSDTKLTIEGLELLRRTEKLLADASSNMTKFVGPVQQKGGRNLLGQGADRLPSDTLIWGSLLVFGVVAIAAVVIAANYAPTERGVR